jgi:hypothetical protein
MAGPRLDVSVTPMRRSGGSWPSGSAIHGMFETHPNIFAFGVLTTLFSLALLAVYALPMALAVGRASAPRSGR